MCLLRLFYRDHLYSNHNQRGWPACCVKMTIVTLTVYLVLRFVVVVSLVEGKILSLEKRRPLLDVLNVHQKSSGGGKVTPTLLNYCANMCCF